MDDLVSFGAWVQQRRKALDLTQAELAGRVGCAVVTIKKIEGDERRPSRHMAELLADRLRIPSLEREAFLRRARGQFVSARPSLAEAIHLPAFLKLGEFEGPRTFFVARERELGQLEAHLNPVLAGRGRVVFITGEAGQGKTSLMTEFARRAQAAQPGLIVAGGSCNAYAGLGDPYLPFRDIFSLLTGDLETRLAAGTLSAEQAHRLWRLLPQTLEALAEHGPDLPGVLVSGPALTKRVAPYAPAGAEWWNRWQALVEAPKNRPAGLDQRQLFEQVSLALGALAARQPLLLLLDDLQWADSASLNLLFHLGRRLAGQRILMLGAYRASELALAGSGDRPPHALEGLVDEFKRRLGDIQLDLEGFLAAEEQAFVDALLDSEPNRLGPAFRETLVWHTKGHPLFTIELLRDMQERGNLVRDEAGRWVEGPALDWNSLPLRVEAVIKQRIDRLDASLQELLTIASIEGELFTAQVVARAQGQDESQVLHQLAGELGRRHRLVREYEEIKVGSHYLTRFQFGHVLFQQYLYQRLSRAERRLWHGKIARILETLYAGHISEIVFELAHHYTEAGNPEKAVLYLRQAGDRARGVAAPEQAIRFYRAALERWPDGEQAGQAETLRKLGECLWLVGQFQDALAAYQAGQGLFEQLGDRLQAGAVQRLIGRLYWEQGGDRARALHHYQQALAILEQEPASVELARAISAISQMHMSAFENDRAVAWGERALALAGRLGAEDVVIHALNNIGSAYAAYQDRERGLAMLQDSLGRALALGLPHDACRAYGNMGDALIWACRYAEARATFEELLMYATRVHAVVFVGFALARLAELEWLAGQWAAALARRPRLREWMEGAPTPTVTRVWAGAWLGWMHNDLAQPGAARQVLEADLPAARGLAEVQSSVPHLGQLARAFALLGLEAETAALVGEFLDVIDGTPDAHPSSTLPLLFACQWLAGHPAAGGLPAARACLRRLEQAHRQSGSADMEAAYHEGRGIIALAGDDPAGAVGSFGEAAGRWQALNRPYDGLRALRGLARALEGVGDLRGARTALDRALQLVDMLAAQLDDPALKTTFLNSPLVQEVQFR